jgi:hypothetical protein
MQRTLTLIGCGLAIAPLFYLAGFAITGWWTKGSTGPDSSIAAAMMTVLVASGAAIVGFALVLWLASRFVGDPAPKILQMASVIVIVGWVVGFKTLVFPDLSFEYSGHRAVLDVEARVPSSALGDRPVASALAISFTGGQDLDVKHPDQVRREGEFTILPWETTPITLPQWEVRVALDGKAALFRPDLPKRPQRSTEWSAWIAPLPGAESETAARLTIRYRFRLVPYGSE